MAKSTDADFLKEKYFVTMNGVNVGFWGRKKLYDELASVAGVKEAKDGQQNVRMGGYPKPPFIVCTLETGKTVTFICDPGSVNGIIGGNDAVGKSAKGSKIIGCRLRGNTR